MKVQHSIAVEKVRVDDGFWNKVQDLVREVVIPYQADVMEDKVPDVEKSRAIENFRIAAGDAEGEFYGFVFQDSDLAKWLEAAAYSLAGQPDPGLEDRIDGVIDLIGRAQEPDGYINTYFSLKHPERKWQNLHDCHELYCSGHFIEAAVAYYQATGKDKFLNIMRRNADLICRRFGNGKIRGIPGHQEIEIALLRLYKVTGEKSYLETAQYFIDERGTEPSYFEEEGKKRDWVHWSKEEKRDYAQNHKPVREQDTAVGHSVRAVYMYTAMVDLAAEIGDKTLFDACEKLWENITQKQMYITGGIGSTVHGEAFSVDYDLPNDTTYSETCASIAMCFFAKHMLEMDPNGKYADVMERMFYNTVLASMQFDGKRFFYVNPLEVIPGISGVVQTHKHARPQRPEWHACACCPPNISRLLLSLGKYAWGEGKGIIYSHMFLGGSAELDTVGGVKIDCKSNYPYDCNISYMIDPEKSEAEFCFAVHIPSWCRDVTYSINGNNFDPIIKDGYAYFTRNWKSGDLLEINANLPVLRIYSNLAVSGNAGMVCLQRGPLVYCLEEIDNNAPLAALQLPPDSEIKIEKIPDGILEDIYVLKADGIKQKSNPDLYTEQKPIKDPVTIQAIPYYAWGNRKPGEMRVWIRE